MLAFQHATILPPASAPASGIASTRDTIPAPSFRGTEAVAVAVDSGDYIAARYAVASVMDDAAPALVAHKLTAAKVATRAVNVRRVDRRTITFDIERHIGLADLSRDTVQRWALDLVTGEFRKRAEYLVTMLAAMPGLLDTKLPGLVSRQLFAHGQSAERQLIVWAVWTQRERVYDVVRSCELPVLVDGRVEAYAGEGRRTVGALLEYVLRREPLTSERKAQVVPVVALDAPGGVMVVRLPVEKGALQ
jgi:hypothetical protein